MSEGLGLEITVDHLATLERCEQTPISFRVSDTSHLPSAWMTDIPPRNQGSFSCCVGGGLSGCFEHRQLVETGEFVRHSMWQAYIEAQRACGMIGRDCGASLAGALQAAGSVGVCLNDLCKMPSSYTTKIPEAATADAARHKHLGNVSYDCRDWDRMIDWITNRDPVLFGGRWRTSHAELNPTRWVESAQTQSSGSSLGYHCRYLCGWTTVGGMIVPLCRNTHGAGHGRNGVVAITREAWDVYCRDPNFVALAFGDIAEREPKRRSWFESKAGDTC